MYQHSSTVTIIPQHFPAQKKEPKKFAKLMGMGKIREALRCIDNNTVGGVLNVNDIINLPNCDRITVLNRLKQMPQHKGRWLKL